MIAVEKVLGYKSTILADNGTKTDALDLKGLTLVGVQLPAGIVSTALTFETSSAVDGTFAPVTKVDGSAVSYTIAASKYVAIDPKDFYGVGFVKLVFGSSETGGPLTIVTTLKGF